MKADTRHGTGERGPGIFRRRAFIIVLSVAAALYLLGINSHWRFQRDSAVYLSLARSLLEGEGYVYNYEPHTYYPPGFPVMLAGLAKLSGMPESVDDSFLVMNILETVLGLGCIVLLYLILVELSVPHVLVVFAIALFAFSRTLYYYSTHVMTDVPFVFFALATLWCGLKMLHTRERASWLWCVAAGALALLASTVRPLGPALAFSILLGLWFRRGAFKKWASNSAKSLMIVAFVGVPLYFWLAWTRGVTRPSGRGYFRTMARAGRLFNVFTSPVLKLPEHMDGLSDTVCGTGLGAVVGSVILLVILIGLVRAVAYRKELVMSSFAILCIAAILAGGWPVSRRYMLPVLPMVLYWLVLGAAGIGNWLRTRTRFWSRRRVMYLAVASCGLVVLVNVIRIGKVVIENRSAEFYQVVDDGRVADYRPILVWLRENAGGRDGSVLAREARMIHCFAGVHTVPLPNDTRDRSKEWIIERLSQGVRYVVKDKHEAESHAVLDQLTPQDGIHLRRIVGRDAVSLFEVVM